MSDEKTENEPIHMEDAREQQDASTVEADGLEHETIDPDDED